jgi:5-methyltetrahydropteroyltriglutamate--homocysteine methyltransferase
LRRAARGRPDPTGAQPAADDLSLCRALGWKGRKMLRSKPPFRADHVGSLLRPAALKEARAKHARGEISADELTVIEDRAIENVIRKQEAVGLKTVTDGEFRRAFWNYDFLGALEGVEAYLGERKIKFQGAQPKPMMLRVVDRLGGYRTHPMIAHFKFLAAHAQATPKMTIPSPSSLHFRYGRDAVPEAIYPGMDDFYRDLGASYRKAVRAFADAGCRYLQLDEVNFTYLCDPKLRALVADRGEDPERLPHVYAGMINAAISDLPADVTTAMHLCRGNFQSTFVASGGYEPVAEILFNAIGIDAYFMEYDSPRAGSFEPLRFVPKGKTVVLGLVTTKSGALEGKDALKRRIDEAAKFVDLDQLCLSPQCGFASTEEGNILAEDEQWAKLAMIVELADEVWG